MSVNPVLLRLASRQVWKQASQVKQAFQPPGADAGGAPPAGGAPGAAPGGAPPMDPSMGGAPPAGMPPGGAPPMGAPPMGDPATMGMAPGTPAAGGQMPGQGPPKLKPDQLMMMLDYRMYNLQQQMTAIMNSLGIQLPPEALIMPPGQPGAPPAESALPGGPNDATGQQQAAGGQQSAIKPVEPMQGASPEMAQAGGADKQASWIGGTIDRSLAPSEQSPVLGAAAMAAIYRSKARAGQRE